MHLMTVMMLWLAVVAAAAPPQSPDRLLVSPAWLAEHLRDPDLVLLHVGDQASYAKGHIPGARQVGLYDLSLRENDAGLRLEMLPAGELRAKLEAVGISDDSRIVLYYDSLGGVTQTTRLMFTLDVAGLGARSSVLDGGLAAWTRAGHPTTTDVPAPRPGQLSPLETRQLVVGGDEVLSRVTLLKRNVPGPAIVDARTAAFYSGEQTGGSPQARHRTGHIPGAGSVPYTSVVTDILEWKSFEELRALFDRAGVKAGDTVIAYCHIGQQATAAIFAARLLGHRVLLYDGSFEDWSRRPDAPVEIKK